MTTQRSPRIVVSVLHWNTAELSARCLRALYAMDVPLVRIVLVDNASADDSVASLRGEFPDLEILQNRSNLGFAGGHELALQFAQANAADAIWLVNSDAEPAAAALGEMVTAWQRQGDALYGAAPVERDANGRLWLNFPAKYLDPCGRPRVFQRDSAVEWTPQHQRRDAVAVGAVAGSCMLIPLSVIRAHGWLDPAWFMYCEEIDYCYRLRRHGVTAYFVPRAFVQHRGAGSQAISPAVAHCMAYYQTRNEIELTRRHRGQLAAAAVAFKKMLRAAFASIRDRGRGALIFRGVIDALHRRMGKTIAPEQLLAESRR